MTSGREEEECWLWRTEDIAFRVRDSGLCLQGPHMHTGQAEPGWWQLLALAVLVEADVEEEVTCVEEEEGPKAGRLA